MFQQMQEMVRLHESLSRDWSRPGGRELDERVAVSDHEVAKEKLRSTGSLRATETGQPQIHRLQAIILQQAKELETLQKRERDATADGRLRPTTPTSLLVDNQREGDVATRTMLHDEEEDTDSEKDSDEEENRSDYRSAARRRASQLRKLPLTSLHAQLKGKDLQLQRLQRIIAKLETRFGQLVDRKRSMAQSLQQTARTQQAHLKKYLSYIRQQTAEKKALERQVCDLNQYIAALEKKVLGSAPYSSKSHTEIPRQDT